VADEGLVVVPGVDGQGNVADGIDIGDRVRAGLDQGPEVLIAAQ
jgi:hypothetical protein